MITFIICGVLIAWCIFKRTRPEGKIQGMPLGLPRGTVRAVITIIIVSFPLQLLITRSPIPGLVVNALFIVVAFYFEARKPGEDRLKRIIKELKNPEKHSIEEKRIIKPLYLPKYSVRFILLLLLLLIILMSIYYMVSPESTNSIMDVILIIGLYMLGSLMRGIGVRIERNKIKEQIKKIQNLQSLSKYQIIEQLMEEKLTWWQRKGKSILSLSTLTCVIVSLALYTANFEVVLLENTFYTLTLQGILLLTINLYYGIRE